MKAAKPRKVDELLSQQHQVEAHLRQAEETMQQYKDRINTPPRGASVSRRQIVHSKRKAQAAVVQCTALLEAIKGELRIIHPRRVSINTSAPLARIARARTISQNVTGRRSLSTTVNLPRNSPISRSRPLIRVFRSDTT